MSTNYGLLTVGDDKQVPLKRIDVRASVLGFVATVEYTLTYRNEEATPVEAVFTFPLDEQSAIYRFEAEVEGRLVVGECQGKEEAEQTYQDAVEAGQSAFLLEESDETADVFQCRVGNLPPDTEATIRFAYCIELNIEEDGSVKFIMPSVLGERYGSGGTPTADLAAADQTGSKGKKTTRARPVYANRGSELPYTFSFEAEVRGKAVSKITPSFQGDHLHVTGDKKKDMWKVRLDSEFKFDHDLILYIFYKDPFTPHVQVEMGDPNASGLLKENLVMLNFLPELSVDGAASDYKEVGEYIIVVDRSGSMNGINMDSAKKALGQFLNVLPEDCYFNIVSFGSSYSALFQNGSAKLTPTTLGKARTLQKSMAANMGGTQIYEALDFVYKQPTKPGYPRQIFLMTDGDVWNSQNVIELVGKHANNTRMFSFGIGCGASTALVKGVARAGRGKAEFVNEREIKKLPEKVEATLRRAMQPNVNNVSLVWGAELKAIHIPGELPPIFMGERMITYAVVKGTGRKQADAELEVELLGSLKGKEIRHKMKFIMRSDPTDVAPIHRLAAKAKIKELEIDEGYTEKHKKEITLLSTSANIVSKYTSYVGVDKERPDKITGNLARRDVPIAPKRSAALAVPSGPGGAVHYGGACFDAMDAWKYIGGKTAMLPPEFDAWPEACPTTGVADAETLRGSVNENVLNDEEPMEVDEAELQLSVAVAETANQDTEKTTGQTAKRKKQRKLKFTHKKRCTRPPATSSLMFAQWNEDGYFYPAQITRQIYSDRFEVKFRDGVSQTCGRNKLLAASLLSPGDVVCFSTLGSSAFQDGLLLEYDKEYDQFHVARTDGVIFSLYVVQMMLPRQTAAQLVDRTKASCEPRLVCRYPETSEQKKIRVSTADVSELRFDGWINETVVNFFLRYIWEECLSDEETKLTEYLPPEFYSNLSRDTTEGTYSRSSDQSVRFERVRLWTRRTDLLEKCFVFVPIFEITHWFVIVILLEKKSSRRDGQLDTIRVRYEVMDSYFADARLIETNFLSGFLKCLCAEQGYRFEASEGARQLNVPVQQNESDCGLCMLQNVEMYFREDLCPRPNLKWYSIKTLDKKRQFLAGKMMQLYLDQMVRT